MAPHHYHHPIIIFVITTTTTILPIFPSIHATEFIFNNFTTPTPTTSNQNKILLYGSAKLQSSTLTLTNDSTFNIGRALYFSKISTKLNNSILVRPFSSSFIFSITPYKHLLAGHGFAFILTPSSGINGTSSSQHLGLFNLTNDGKFTNHVFAVEFDVFKNQEFNDLDNNHVGVDVNSLTSVASNAAGFWSGDNDKFKNLKLNNGVNYQVWIDYYDMVINVTIAKVGQVRPNRPLISTFLNLSSVLLDEMYVGFTAATGQLVQSHRILSWAFSNKNLSIGDALVTSNLPTFVDVSEGSIYRSKKFIFGFTFSFLCVVCLLALLVVFVRRKRRFWKGREGIEEWEAEYWPHRISYDEIEAATKGFSKESVIGIGGNGMVYRGVLLGGSEVAVKTISYENERGVREFLAEVSSLGRLKHRSLVGLIGWCKKDRGSVILVYDFMKNGSLDKRLFECDQTIVLSWEERLKILQDVASAILYLHEGWDVKVLHRDIKSSNVLLDNDMNAKLGDFGLALMHQHEAVAGTTQVVGTVGYLAPEVVQTGRVSTQTDVFGFGVLVLEVVSGRRPIEEGKPGLVDWVWGLMEQKELIVALDEKMKSKGGYSDEEVEKVLSLGLLCVYPNPQNRPTIRQIVKALDLNNAGGEAYLLDETRTRAMWSSYQQNFGAGRHPTLQEMHNTLPLSSVSLSESMLIIEGR